MKKNISINISGIIFHIEEDGYEQLKEYLDSINKYFSTFDDSSEIIADIESRIAEIFLEKLTEDKQVISNEDVIALATTMGSIQDFQAVEDDNDVYEEPLNEEKQAESKSDTSGNAIPNKRLYRDNKRKLLGGVASGIANYFSIDPVWIRLGFIVLLFDAFITFSVSPIAMIAYLVMWIALPASDVLEEDKSMKKLYRNPDGKVIAGVAQGLGKFLDIDVTVVRVLLVLSIFIGGTGLIAYVVLWIILPEATTITDRVQMEGEKVTLENIDSSIKKAQDKDANPVEESTLASILLFPFRLLGKIFKGIGFAIAPIINFIVQLARIFAGVIITIVGMSSLFSITIAIVILLGVLSGLNNLHLDFIPFEILSDSIPTVGVVGIYLVTAIPALLLLLVGISLLSKKSILAPTFGWAMFGIWVIGIIMMSLTIPNLIYQYKENARVTETTEFNSNYDAMYFAVEDTGLDDFIGMRIKMKGYDGDEVKLISEYSAQGPTKREAAKNAKMIDYNVVQNDSVLQFDSNIQFKDDALFRDQHLKLTLMVPYNLQFKMDEDFGDLLKYGISSYGFYSSDLDGNTFFFNESGLDCPTCLSSENSMAGRRDNYEEVLEESSSNYGNSKAYDFQDFESVKIAGPFNINIAQGEEYRVVLSGSEYLLEEIEVSEEGGQLRVLFNEEELNNYRHTRKINLRIIMPSLSKIDVSSAANGNIAGFDESKLDVKLSGASKLTIDTDVKFINIKLNSASTLNLIGKGNELEATMSSAAHLEAYKYNAQNVRVKVSSAAKAKVYATETLRIDASSLGNVKYRGGAEITRKRSSSLGQISED